MILYLLKSALCMLFFWGFYHLVLQNEKMFVFNRFYLLGSLLFSLFIPNLYLEYNVVSESIPSPLPLDQNVYITTENQANWDYSLLFQWGYLLVTFLLLLKYSRGLWWMIQKVSRHKQLELGSNRVVLISQQEMPHTFFRYIILNEETYLTGRLDDAVLQHEAAHARQLHSLDIVLVELLKVLFWFNPMLTLYTRSIRANHEFLADEYALHKLDNIPHYQQLLLEMSTAKKAFNNRFSNGINFYLTKKRFIMMTKKTSEKKSYFYRGASLLMFLLAFFLFSNTMLAQDGATPKEIKEYMELVLDNYDQDGKPKHLSKEEEDRMVAIYRKLDGGQRIVFQELELPVPASVPKMSDYNLKGDKLQSPPPPPPFPENARFFIDGKEVTIYEANMMRPNYKHYKFERRKGKEQYEFHITTKEVAE